MKMIFIGIMDGLHKSPFFIHIFVTIQNIFLLLKVYLLKNNDQILWNFLSIHLTINLSLKRMEKVLKLSLGLSKQYDSLVTQVSKTIADV